MASLRLCNIRKRYGASDTVIENLNLTIRAGEFMVLVGPSGCGKSTLLRMIAGLEDITGGELFIDDIDHRYTPPAKRGVAMVFQSYALYPHMSVAENMGFALRLAGHTKQQIKQRVGSAAEILRISHLLDRKPKDLSGGQRQRVAIGRAITRKPKVFLFDEPLSNLDASLRVQMRIELRRLHEELGATMIYVTHDQVEAMTLGDRVALLNQGNLEQVGPPIELYAQPANRFVAEFLGSPKMNLLPCRLEPIGGGSLARVSDQLALKVPYPLQRNEGPAMLGIRPEHFKLTRAGNGSTAFVEVQERLGDASILHARLASEGERVAVKLNDAAQQFQPGDTVTLNAVEHTCHVFDPSGASLRVA
ncbi:sugar ABC transporter ATP-binding protein [Alkalilimnicola ehrlichii]|uniref:Sugar ABC transporter ATP-binding protein n=1 Tax=Alkalilimnicola ehrlichii TaxID=351052 RepID=A0A3E0WUU6_9GAMM|nr:sn-glycerol-3-phosphate ABC transporter ATP-binding protein UgpC [Alkalilimnicola ehrlichii]RFA28602.1 sugar ABC transporter ATP-binding protein [Alkalilimnicola ehrlichii]RFA35766.1 sugar ABC transporter ATP-binding protein [Alkalilimnicola ehrlichii]